MFYTAKSQAGWIDQSFLARWPLSLSPLPMNRLRFMAREQVRMEHGTSHEPECHLPMNPIQFHGVFPSMTSVVGRDSVEP